MKVLIVYASAGTGHRRAAEAIFQSLDSQLQHDARLVDILSFSPPFFKRTYAGGYTFLITQLPWIWGFLYWFTNLKILAPCFRLSRRCLNYFNSRRFVAFLEEHNPEVIIATHFKPNTLISDLKRKKRISSFLISVVTDYAVHSFWLAKGVDIFVVPLDSLKITLLRGGIPEDKIKVLGIPVAKEFFNLKPRPEAAQVIGIKPERFTALLVTGAIGFNALHKIARRLKNSMQVIVLCGRNKKLLRYFQNVHSEDIFAFPVVRNIPDFLAASDILITKAGGLTITEALVTEKPLVFMYKIPGQEAANIEALTANGAALYEKNLGRLTKRVIELKENQPLLLKMKKDLARIAKRDVNLQIASLIKNNVR